MSESKNVPYLPPCRVCKSVASGFHYGVNTCEACKGFFRRSLSRKKPYPDCTLGGSCSIEGDGRNLCTSCRYQKCVAVGMSKLTIKTGRYTHEKRTLDTLEIKQTSEDGSGAAIDSRRSSSCDSPCSSQPVDYTTSTSRSRFERTTITKAPEPSHCSIIVNEDAVHMFEVICNAFRVGFPDTTFMFDHPEKVEAILKIMLDDKNISELDNVMTYTGGSASAAEIKTLNTLKTQAEVLSALETLNSSVSSDLLWDLPKYQHAAKDLFETCSGNVDKFITEFVMFAKQLPGFSLLPVEEQSLLIKHSRPEVTALVKFKHFNRQYRVTLNYQTSSETMVIFPVKLLRKMFLGKNELTSEYVQLFRKMLQGMWLMDITLSDIAVLCAMTVLSPDRDYLCEETRLQLSKIQDNLIPVLNYSLRKHHPKGNSPKVLSRYLMLLPALRELNHYHSLEVKEAHKRLNPHCQNSNQFIRSIMSRYFLHE